MTKNNIEYKISRKLKFKSRKSTIYELAIINEIPRPKVFDIYLRFNTRVYNQYSKENPGAKAYNPVLEQKVFDLTDKYFGIEREKMIKELNKKIKKIKESKPKIQIDI